MIIHVDRKDIDKHTSTILELLKSQEYDYANTKLTREERLKLYDLFFTFDSFGEEESYYGDFDTLTTKEEVKDINERIYEDMDEEVKQIILKCGVNPKKVFVLDKENICDIDPNLNNSMIDYGSLDIGDYHITTQHKHPIRMNSRELEDFEEEYQDSLYEEFKDGEIRFDVTKNIDGKLKRIYSHSESIQFKNFIFYKSINIGSAQSISGYRFDIEAGMMVKDAKISKKINEIMDFFDDFESLLSKNSKLILK